MPTQATELRRLENVERVADGVYDGVWGAYTVRFDVAGAHYEARAEAAIRTPQTPCKVTSKDGRLTVEATEL